MLQIRLHRRLFIFGFLLLRLFASVQLKHSRVYPLCVVRMTAPQLVEVADEVVADLKKKLVDPNSSLPEKYRVLFSLRNVKGAAAHDALELGAFFGRCLPNTQVHKRLYLHIYALQPSRTTARSSVTTLHSVWASGRILARSRC